MLRDGPTVRRLLPGTGLRPRDSFGRYGIEIDARTPASPRGVTVLATVPPLHASALRHATTALTTAAPLLAGRGRRTAETWPGLPELPAAWLADPNSRISTPTQRFTAYRRGATEIQLHSVTATLEAPMDIQGILGIDSDVRNGFDGIKVTYDIKADATPEEIRAIVAQSQKRSAVYDVITNPTNVTVEVR